jgi:hypothetical protein
VRTEVLMARKGVSTVRGRCIFTSGAINSYSLLVHHLSTLLAAMPSQICLPIPVNVEPAHHSRLAGRKSS